MADELTSFSGGVNWYADYDVRSIGMAATNNATETTMRFIEVPTPAWFPDSFLRSLKNNLYYKMVNNASFDGTPKDSANTGECLDFYKDNSSGNVLGNLVNTAIKSVVSVAANQVTSIASKVDSVVNGVSSLFGGGDGGNKSLYKLINETARVPFLSSQPYLKINGIHLSENIKNLWMDIHNVGIVIGNIFSGLLDKKLSDKLKDFNKKFENKLKASLKSLGILGKDAGDADLDKMLSAILTKDEMRMHSFAEQQLLSEITGYYTLTCKLPYFGERQPMMKSSGANAWVTGHGAKPEGGDNGILSILREYSNIVWNNPLKWNPEDVGKDNFSPVRYSFDIYNDTLEHVLTNLAFIWTFGATTQSVTDIVTMRPPYLYDIEIPGGMRYKYCTCGFQVTPMGKLRRVASNSKDDAGMMGDLFKKVFGITVNPNAISHVPDYYKVEMLFQPLLPNTWNFIHSYLTDADSKPQTGQEIRHLITKVLRDFAGN